MTHLPAPGRPVPSATYRLQLHAGFGFDDAAAVVDRLADLGVSHVYCSPILAAAPGSMHGYDVVDHDRLNPELGGEPAWTRLVEAARSHGLGLVVDVVPNHMAVPTPESLNRPLWDVLGAGRSSPYAGWFDVDWDAQDGRLLMPVLGAPVGACVERGELVVGAGEDGAPLLRYHDHAFPLAAGTESLDLPALLDAQHYRVAFWRVATEELNYRRFFDVTSLIAVRVEDPVVFDATHRLLLRLVAAGEVDGLRVDHPDGLADPTGYLERLADATGGAWVVVEKILEGDEELPAAWRCAGTTGYDVLDLLTGVFVDPAGGRPLADLYRSLTGMPVEFATVVERAKRTVVTEVLAAEVDRLLRLAVAVAHETLDTRDWTRGWVHDALVELLVAFGVYRAYLPADEVARSQVTVACRRAAAARPQRRDQIDWLGRLALGEVSGSAAAGEFAVRFGQTTGPVTAKGVEDTAFYRYHRLAALTEVGGDPGRFGRSPAELHAWCVRTTAEWPTTMTTLSTHDTKRSEDVRARLAVLAEIPTEWAEAVTGWRAAAARHRGPDGPDANLEYLFWQTVVGAWPIDADRMRRYLEKASREAKQHTSWVDPVPAYDAAVRAFVDGVYGDPALLDDVAGFVRRHLLVPGRANALAQKLVQLTMPGVPDIYQGSELWDLSLVDPDNRRPVDHDLRRRLLTGLDRGEPLPTLAADEPGVTKLLVVARALRLRRDRPDAFGPAAGHRPLTASGSAADHVLGFVRGDDVVTVVARLPVGLERRGGWADTTVPLPDGRWRDRLTGAGYDGGAVPVAGMLTRLPVALLVRDSGTGPAEGSER